MLLALKADRHAILRKEKTTIAKLKTEGISMGDAGKSS